MVTGDHPLTAEAIARKVNIITGRTAREVAAEDGVDEDEISLADPRVEAVVFSGKEIREKLVTDAQWDAVLSKPEVVFARTTPQQKLIIVQNYQRRGEIVAVTGDGVNDSPALKRADIGVAMAISGSAVAKAVSATPNTFACLLCLWYLTTTCVCVQASDIMLMDDNFASIVNAIEEGRLLFDNLKKSIAYTLAHLWPELLPVFLNVAFSFPLALPGLIILIIDLFQEQGPAVSFAYEKAEGSIMQRPPRDQKRDRLVRDTSATNSV
jgi:sodium/potassium-transporting ATPase subunit alpha